MRGRLYALFLIALLMAPLPAAAQEGTGSNGLPFDTGENLQFSVHWLFFHAGMIESSVPESFTEGESRYLRFRLRAWTTNFIAHIFTMNDVFESVWNPDRRLPRSLTVRIRESSTTKDKVMEFNHDRKEAVVTEDAGPGKTFELASDAQDFFSASYIIRTMELKVGQKFGVPVFEDNKNYSAEIKVVKRERLPALGGEVDTVMIIARLQFEGALQGGKELHVWMTDDWRHVPVRMRAEFKFGTVLLELVKAEGTEIKFVENHSK